MDTDCRDQFTPGASISVDSWNSRLSKRRVGGIGSVGQCRGWREGSYWLQRPVQRPLLLCDSALWNYLQSELPTCRAGINLTDAFFTPLPPPPLPPHQHSPVDALCCTCHLRAMEWITCVCGGRQSLRPDWSMLSGVTSSCPPSIVSISPIKCLSCSSASDN